MFEVHKLRSRSYTSIKLLFHCLQIKSATPMQLARCGWHCRKVRVEDHCENVLASLVAHKQILILRRDIGASCLHQLKLLELQSQQLVATIPDWRWAEWPSAHAAQQLNAKYSALAVVH
jgi:hypothetical protein